MTKKFLCLLKAVYPTAFAVLLLGVYGHADATYTIHFSDGTGGIYTGLTGSSTVSETIGSILPVGSSNIFTQAIAGPNHLGVLGDASATAVGLDSNTEPNTAMASILFSAALDDTLYLANAPTNGMLTLYVHINGLSIVYGVGQADPLAWVGLYGTSSGGRAPYGSCVVVDSDPSGRPPDCAPLVDGTDTLHVPYVLQSNNTVPLDLTFEGVDQCIAMSGPPNGTVAGSCYADSAFIDTAQVAKIVIEGSNGNPVPGATATSLNGVSYTLPTPEPSTLLMLGSGVLGLAGLVRRKLSL